MTAPIDPREIVSDSFDVASFDLDGTLAVSKSPLAPHMAATLALLLQAKRIAVLSGASFAQFEKQFVAYLGCGPELLKQLFLVSTNGASMREYREGEGWHEVYKETLSQADKSAIMDAFDTAFSETHFVFPQKMHGVLIEDRDSQVTFSGLGSSAPVAEKQSWDPLHEKRDRIAAVLRQLLPGFAVSVGGMTSIDVTKQGVDKVFGLKKLSAHLGIPLERFIYVGDALFPGGNDEAVLQSGVRTIAVRNPDDTEAFIRKVLSAPVA